VRKIPATKLARQETQANLMSLPVESAALITSVSTRTVARDREDLQLKSLANLSESTEEYWQEEMTRIMSDVEYLREKAKRTGLDNLLLATLDRWLKLVEMNVVKRSISAHVDLSEPEWVVEFRRNAAGLSEEDFPLIWGFMRALPRKPRVLDASCFPPPMVKELAE